MGGTPEQVENAAEITLEHHLGMTCDPVVGLVQIPCIETMRQTGLDMSESDRETSLAGLAVNVVAC